MNSDEPKPKGRFVFTAIIIMLIIAAAIVGYVLIAPLFAAEKPALVQETPATTPAAPLTPAPAASQAPATELKITNLKLCDSVSDDYICAQNNLGEFAEGQSFFIYAEISGLSSTSTEKGYFVSFTGTLVTKNPSGQAADSYSGTVLDVEDYLKKMDAVKVKIPVTIDAGSQKGAYTYKFMINDKVGISAASAQGSFKVK